MEILVVVLGTLLALSVAVNVVLVQKVNRVKALRKAERAISKQVISATVKAACEVHNNAIENDKINVVLEQQLEVAKDVVESLSNKIDDLRQEVIRSHESYDALYSTMYRWLKEGRVVKKRWNDSVVEYYKFDSLSLDDINAMLGLSDIVMNC